MMSVSHNDLLVDASFAVRKLRKIDLVLKKMLLSKVNICILCGSTHDKNKQFEEIY